MIEASWLFGFPADRIDVVVHPESIVHSMVEYADGSVIAQLAMPDMKTPIALAMGWPERIDGGTAKLSLAAMILAHELYMFEIESTEETDDYDSD